MNYYAINFYKKLRTNYRLIILLLILFSIPNENNYKFRTNADDETLISVNKHNEQFYIHGIHLTAWKAGSKQFRKKIEKYLSEDKCNTLVIAVKEYTGEVYIPDVDQVKELGSFVNAIPDIKQFINILKSKKIYTIARIVVFKDNIAARKRSSWAIKTPDGTLWTDYKGITWLDPYNKETWDYNISIAEQCANLGFDEIQFDYIRFPSDGDIKTCRYSQHHSSITAIKCISDFLKEAKTRIKSKYNVNISVDIFGLTTSVFHDMGIGQNIICITDIVDYVCPMLYPSHYNKGELGIPDPNKSPYETVFRSLSDASKRLGKNYIKLRPYLQDFSLGYKYGIKEVEQQIRACYDNNIFKWTLWNPTMNYTFDIFEKDFINNIQERYYIEFSSK